MIMVISSGLLLVMLGLLFVLAFIISKFDILHPWVIICSMMTASALFACIGSYKWSYYISVDAALVVISAVIMFGIGAVWTDYYMGNKVIWDDSMNHDQYIISNERLIVAIVLVLFFSYLQVQETYRNSLLYGNTEGYWGMVRVMRKVIESNTFSYSRWRTYRTIIASSIMYCSLFTFLYNMIYSVKVYRIKAIKFLLPIISYFPFLLVSGGREGILEIVLFALMSGSILYGRKNKFSLTGNRKILLAFFLSWSGFIVLFLLFGFITGKVRIGGRGPLTIITHYLGLSFPALTLWLKKIPIESPLIGSTTLMGIYGNLRTLGMKLPKVISFLPFVGFEGISENYVNTNVYTTMMRYIKDYGYVGMMLIMSFLGILYSFMYSFLKYRTKHLELIAMYSTILMPLFFSMNDERFLMRVLTTATVYKFVALFFTFKILVKQKNSLSNQVKVE